MSENTLDNDDLSIYEKRIRFLGEDTEFGLYLSDITKEIALVEKIKRKNLAAKIHLIDFMILATGGYKNLLEINKKSTNLPFLFLMMQSPMEWRDCIKKLISITGHEIVSRTGKSGEIEYGVNPAAKPNMLKHWLKEYNVPLAAEVDRENREGSYTAIEYAAFIRSREFWNDVAIEQVNFPLSVDGIEKYLRKQELENSVPINRIFN